jgi:hypothetical protein
MEYSQHKLRNRGTTSLILAGLLICVAHAQEVARIDLRPGKSSGLDQDIPELSRQSGCSNKNSGLTVDGEVTSDSPKRILLSIVKTNTHRALLGQEIQAEVTMKNLGPAIVEIPWNIDPHGLRAGEDDDYKQWETGEFVVLLQNNNRLTKLKSLSKLLYGSPFSPGSTLKLGSGEWVRATIRFKLGPAHPEFDQVRAGKAQLVVEWYQEQRTYKRMGCDINSGFFPYKKYYQQDQKKTKFMAMKNN